MPLIEVKSDFLASRGQEISRLLRPLTKTTSGPAWNQKNTRGDLIIGTHDGAPPTSDYRDWRFATFVSRIRAMYFELWRRENRAWYLDRAYMTIFKLDERTLSEYEFLSLHCDPNEPLGSAHSKYKKGPHIHVKAAEEPIPHAHIALNRGHLTDVLSSVSSLSRALEDGIVLVREQILDAM